MKYLVHFNYLFVTCPLQLQEINIIAVFNVLANRSKLTNLKFQVNNHIELLTHFLTEVGNAHDA